jgi:hypothetical protein
VFLKGFKEAIGIAVALVAVYLALNTVVVDPRTSRPRYGSPARSGSAIASGYTSDRPVRLAQQCHQRRQRHRNGR